MIREPQVPLFDLVVSLSKALDLVSPALVDHHVQVAYLASEIATELGMPADQQTELIIAGMLHDSGALSLSERIDCLQFELIEPHKHAELGYLLLQAFDPLSSVANLVRFHHVPWNDGDGSQFNGHEVPMGSHTLHMADRVAVLVDKEHEVLGQARDVCEKAEEQSGGMFMPEVADAFASLAVKECSWLDLSSSGIIPILRGRANPEAVVLGATGLLGLGKLFSQLIDFRSRFTATHSSGVAASAEALARFAGFSEKECQMMRVAGCLHDLGKLAVPAEVLEKPDKLTEAEFNIMRSHTFHTYRCLEPIGELEIANAWASFHHERLDGKGYPFHHTGEDLSLGARIMGVADVFTAVTEDRPYREGMTTDRALEILHNMVGNSSLDSGVVSLLETHFDEINSLRMAAQAAAVEEYQKAMQPLA